MYRRMMGEKYPPAPALMDTENGWGSERAQVALDSDCFSKPSVNTRRWMRPWIREVATNAVDPPTEPAVWTRRMGLPTQPRASARKSSGIIRPSKKSGALPMTTASMSAHVQEASSRARRAASRTSPAMDTSPRVDW